MQPEIFENDQNTLNIDARVMDNDGIDFPSDPLALNIEDDELVKVVEKSIEDSKKFWEAKYNLKKRREKMEKTLFGRTLDDKDRQNELKNYETRYMDNAIYEIEETILPVAMSHIPDLLVTPGAETPESQASSDNVSKAVNDDLKKRQNRKVLSLAFRHLPVYLTGIIKVRWNPEIDDYEFYNPLPERVIIDKAATSNNVEDMRFVAELLSMTVQDAVMRFPAKKQDLFANLKSHGLTMGEDDFNWKDLASEIDIWEVHFTWYAKSDTGQVNPDVPTMEEPGNKWEKIEGVLWKYDQIILKKMKTPNFDYEGQPQMFTYDDPSNEQTKHPVDQAMVPDMMSGMMMGLDMPHISVETTYFNYFKQPKKPYFFMGYDQWGKVALDETSRIEQNLRNQENLDSMGKQMMEQLKKRVKHIWSTDSGLDAGDVQNLDFENPNIDALVDGNVNDVHMAIQPERPDQAQFNAYKMSKDNMFGSAGATSLTGQLQSDVATNNQIAREQNFTRIDNLVEDTINAASEWMAMWALQFIKLRYTEEHFRKLLGNQGSVTFLKLKRDSVEDGMEVMIKASGTDKLKAQRNAMDMAKLGPPYTNPLDFFKDMDISDPEGRAERGITFMSDPATYFTKYIQGLTTPQQQATALNGAPPAPPQDPNAVAPAGGAMTPPISGSPAAPNPTDTTQIAAEPPTLPQGSPRGFNG